MADQFLIPIGTRCWLAHQHADMKPCKILVTARGHVMDARNPSPDDVQCYVVELEPRDQFWSRDNRTFVRLLVAHRSNLSPTLGTGWTLVGQPGT